MTVQKTVPVLVVKDVLVLETAAHAVNLVNAHVEQDVIAEMQCMDALVATVNTQWHVKQVLKNVHVLKMEFVIVAKVALVHLAINEIIPKI